MKRYWALGRLIPIGLGECETVCAYTADDLFRGFAPETDGEVWETVCRSRIRVLRLKTAPTRYGSRRPFRRPAQTLRQSGRLCVLFVLSAASLPCPDFC